MKFFLLLYRNRKKRLTALFWAVCATILFASCAKMGNPDGGWYDETPPRVVGASPENRGLNVSARRQTIYFNEYIKLENATEKVVVSPPQLEMPEIQSAGKSIKIKLLDSLKTNTTYTIDFSDAISDNNEGNPLGNFTYMFSTGDHIDTLEVSGTVLNAEDLEPVKGIMVGLHSNMSDTAFTTQPFLRVGRTDGRGHFSIKGIAPGEYRVFALQDMDNNYMFSQKSEQIAFNHDIVVPSWKPDVRHDTIWRDSIHIERIVPVNYTHFMPDDICLRAFNEVQTNRVLVKNERLEPDHITFFFSYGDEKLPVVRGLDFDDSNAFVVESTQKRDTVTYWLRDTALVNRDTLTVEISYQKTDSVGQLRLQTDTFTIQPKVPYEKRMKNLQKEIDDWYKKQEKLKKKGKPYDSIMPPKTLEVEYEVPGSMPPDVNPRLTVPTPVEQIDKSKIHLYVKRDSLWRKKSFELRDVKDKIRTYEILSEWEPDEEYSLEFDSLCFRDIYGLGSSPVKHGIRISGEDEFSSFFLTLTGMSDSIVVAQLLDKNGATIKTVTTRNGTAEFYYVKPGTYYLRIFVDRNGNGVWDTGNYAKDIQPEPVYYYHEEIECKQKWDVSRTWNPSQRNLSMQKPADLVKQKEEKEKVIKQRNRERALKMGYEIIEERATELMQ